MKFTLATVSIIFTAFTSALPAEDFMSLAERANPSNAPIDWDGPSSSVECGGKTYEVNDIYLAVQQGVNLGLLSPPETRGKGAYPHWYKNNGGGISFPAHCPDGDDKRQEYPVVKNGPYNGSKSNRNTGDERVVFYYDGSSQGPDGHPLVYYCGMLTHKDQPAGQFKKC